MTGFLRRAERYIDGLATVEGDAAYILVARSLNTLIFSVVEERRLNGRRTSEELAR